MLQLKLNHLTRSHARMLDIIVEDLFLDVKSLHDVLYVALQLRRNVMSVRALR